MIGIWSADARRNFLTKFLIQRCFAELNHHQSHYYDHSLVSQVKEFLLLMLAINSLQQLYTLYKIILE
jgi:hypothetical protein